MNVVDLLRTSEWIHNLHPLRFATWHSWFTESVAPRDELAPELAPERFDTGILTDFVKISVNIMQGGRLVDFTTVLCEGV